MGKLLSFVFASVALATLVLVALLSHASLLDDAGLVVSFVFFCALALLASLVTAVRRMAWGERNWRVVVRLVLLFWLPVLPAMIYGLSGLRDLGTRSRRRPAAQPARVTQVVVSGPARLPAADERERDLVGAGDRVGA
jgi:hypothetical protein